MQPETIRSLRRPLIHPLLAGLLAAGTGGAWADDEPNPYYIGVTQAFSHDSNVFRSPEGTGGVRSDSYWSTGLVGGLDQPIGRQRVYASGNVRTNRYQSLDALNNTSYGVNAGLDWSTIERLSGSVTLSLNQNLATYNTLQNNLPLAVRNIEQNGQFQARAQWGLVSLYSLEGSYTHRRLNYSATAYNYYNSDTDVVSLGIKYRPSGLLSLGAAVRQTRGNYGDREISANPPLVGQTYDRTDLDLTANWFATGQSTINARLSIGKQSYNDGLQSDFSGVTGWLNWTYRPTGKLRFDTAISRDTGSETYFNQAVIGVSTGDNSRITTSLVFNAAYEVTAKINLNAGLRFYHRSLDNTFNNGTASAGIDGTDNVRSFSLGASYAPTRNWLLNCNVGRDQRSTALTQATGLSYPYSANTASCSAQFTIQ